MSLLICRSLILCEHCMTDERGRIKFLGVFKDSGPKGCQNSCGQTAAARFFYHVYKHVLTSSALGRCDDTVRMIQAEQSGIWPTPLALGRRLRFAVVDPSTGHRSAIWLAWTGKKVDDVYLCESVTGRDWKVTHHNDWKWRIAMTKERAETRGIERVVIVEWRDRPERGWSEGAGLLIPCTYLRPANEPLPQSVVQVPTPPSHSCVRVRLLFEEPGAVGVRFGRGFPIGVLNRLGGGRVYVLADPARRAALPSRKHCHLSVAVPDLRRER